MVPLKRMCGVSYLGGDGPHTDPTIYTDAIYGLTVNGGIASFCICGKRLIEQRRNTTMIALGAPESDPRESPDSGVSTGSTDTGASIFTSAETRATKRRSQETVSTKL